MADDGELRIVDRAEEGFELFPREEADVGVDVVLARAIDCGDRVGVCSASLHREAENVSWLETVLLAAGQPVALLGDG